MRKFIILSLAVLLFSVGLASADMPDKACYNLALTKDLVTLKNVDYKDIQIEYYYIQDQCTGEVYVCRYGGPCENPTTVLASFDAYPSNYHRTYIPESGTIYGYQVQHGWRGGQKLEYTICGDGRAKVYHTGQGWYGGNRNFICNTLD